MATAPPEPPSPITTAISGTPMRRQQSVERAITTTTLQYRREFWHHCQAAPQGNQFDTARFLGDGVETLYAADAAIERVMQDVLTVPDWNRIVDGTVTSSFVDGAPGARTLPDGSQLNLLEATAMARCGKTSCSAADMDKYTDERPWGPNNPRWQLYAYGRLQDIIQTNTINSNLYVIVWMADDPADNDDNPLLDGGTTNGANPGTGVLSMLAYAYGPTGVRRVIETTVARTDTTEIERGYTGQRGQDEQNRRARKAAVQTPGKALTKTLLAL